MKGITTIADARAVLGLSEDKQALLECSPTALTGQIELIS